MTALLLQALRGINGERAPVWLMRQAGRYLPEYQEMRKMHSLGDLFRTPALATQITLMPIERFHMDAAILFADILLIAEAFGKYVDYPDKGGPRIAPLTKEEIRSLKKAHVCNCLSYVFETIQLVLKECPVPLIGFCGGPFTVACYLLENIRNWIEGEPALLHQLLRHLTEATIEYLQAQVDAGVQVVQIFDSWADRLSDRDFRAFCLPYLQSIVTSLQGCVPTILFCRGSALRANDLVALCPTAISLTEEKSMAVLRQEIPRTIAVQGNLPPTLLLQSKEEIEKEVCSLLQSMHGHEGFIVNLSHGVLPQTPVENVETFVTACKKCYDRV